MGVLIISEQPPATSPYNQWKVYRSATRTGAYAEIITQGITDLTYYDEAGTSTSWYKISYYDSVGIDESALSVPIQGQTTTYTTVRKVESFLQQFTLTDSTSPTVQEVVEIILRKEDEIDYLTGHAWRQRYSNTNTGQATEADYKMYDITNLHQYQTGTPVYLNHRKIRQLDAAEGDVLEFWTGANWEDFLTQKTEGRNNDYWIDYDRGIAYLRGYWNVKKPQGLRIKYRYGETTVNRVIEDIATKLTVIDILLGMDPRAMIVQEGSSTMSHSSRIEMLKKECEQKLNGFKEWQVPSKTI